MGKERLLGAVTGNSLGFTVRMQMNNKKHTGKFGIYAGKKLVTEATSNKEALEMISQSDFVDNWKKKKPTIKRK